MLQQGQTLRRERKSFKLLNEKLFNYWDKFNEHHLTTEQLVKGRKKKQVFTLGAENEQKFGAVNGCRNWWTPN
jgi:hypothetical protein